VSGAARAEVGGPPEPRESGRAARLAESGIRLALVVSSTVLTFSGIELGLRVAGFSPGFKSTALLLSRDGRLLLDCYPTNPRGYFEVDLRTPAARAAYRGLAPRRFEAIAARAPWAVEVRYNSSRFRGREIGPRHPGVRRVMVLGDSFTEGQGVNEQDAYPGVLGALLDSVEPGRWDVFNCGRRATDFPALLEAFGEVLDLDPDLVVYGMVLNDPAQSSEFRARQDYVNDLILDRGRMLIGRPGFEFGPLDSRLAAFVGGRIRSYRVVRETTRWYRDMYAEPNREGWRRTQACIRGMDARMRARRGRLLVASWPLLVGLDGAYPFADASREIARGLTAAGVAHHDLTAALRGRASESLWVHPVDRHPNEVAHRLAAQSLAPVVSRLARQVSP